MAESLAFTVLAMRLLRIRSASVSFDWRKSRLFWVIRLSVLSSVTLVSISVTFERSGPTLPEPSYILLLSMYLERRLSVWATNFCWLCSISAMKVLDCLYFSDLREMSAFL